MIPQILPKSNIHLFLKKCQYNAYLLKKEIYLDVA